MIRETGTVIECEDGFATVRLGRGKRCGGCKVCVHGSSENELLARAHNRIDAAVGDRVEMEVPEVDQVREGFMLFIAPMLLIFFGFTLLSRLIPSLPAALGGLLLGSVPLLILRIREKRGGFVPVLVKILDS